MAFAPKPPPANEFHSFAGIRNTAPAERLAPSDLIDAVNVDIDDAGRASRRAGQTQLVGTAAHSLWAPLDDSGPCLFVQSGSLKNLDRDHSVSALMAGFGTARVRYVKVNDRVYLTDGTLKAVVDGGHARAWGMAIPEGLTATAGSGHLAAGTYLYTFTTLADDGRESGSLAPGAITVSAGAGITFAWGTVAGSKVALYLSEANGTALFQAGVVDASDQAFTWAGGALALPLDTLLLDAPPAAQAIGYASGRIYLGVGPYLFATTALGYELCDLTDYLALDGTDLVFIAGLDSGLFIGTQRAVYFLAGSDLDAANLRVAVAASGVADSALVVEAAKAFGEGGGNVALFTTALGIYMGAPDGSTTNLTQDRYQFTPPATATAALRVENELSQYLLLA